MDLQILLDAANAELATTKSARDAAQTKATAFDQLEAALGDGFKALLGNPAALKAVIEDGKAYRSDLVDDVVALQRGAKVIHSDDEATLAGIKSGYAVLPLSTLKSMREGLLPKTPAAGTIPAGDPNAPTGATGKGAVPEALNTCAI